MFERIGSRASTLQIANEILNGGAPFEHSSDCCQISPKRNSDDSNHFTDFGQFIAGLQRQIFCNGSIGRHVLGARHDSGRSPYNKVTIRY